MKIKNKIFLIIILLILLGIFIIFNTSNIQILETQKLVTKVIDGDTIIVEGGHIVRLLGIDADEKGYPCYESAKQRLEELVLNKRIFLEQDKKDKDQYKRYLRYVFLDDDNINLKLVKEGFVVAHFSDENIKYKEEIINAEKFAIENKIGCKWGNISKTENMTLSSLKEDVIDACDAIKYVNEEKTVKGKIVDGYKSVTNTVFLNFEKPYPNQCFTAVIFSYDLKKFPENPQNYYEGKIVKISGKIKEYKGKPEIILSNMSQIEIL
ncbi:MAG: thermonuclease family protein [Candidatus Aenigmatarchaeota archaeon]